MKTAKDSGLMCAASEAEQVTDTRQNNAHSPLPWDTLGRPGRSVFSTVDGHLVCDMSNNSNRDIEFANAALIVRAVNNFDGLVAALSAMTERYVALVECGDCGNWDAEKVPEVIVARAALKASMDTDSQQTTQDK